MSGLHDHGTGEEGHDDHEGHDHGAAGDEGHGDEHAEYLLVVGKMGVLVAAIYVFWIFESLMGILGRGHSHSHGDSHGHCKFNYAQSIDRMITAGFYRALF